MKAKPLRLISRSRARGIHLSALSLCIAPALFAVDGTWNVDDNGTWSTPGNWVSDTIADGSGFTANFTNDITADRTVSLDGDRTLTNLIFGDSDTATAGSWILNNNGTSSNNLILAGTTPTITVNALGTAKTATISAIIQGSVGLVKAGAGRLDLTGANTFTGGVTIKEGRLSVSGSSSSTTSANPIGTSAGTILLGDTTGSASAQLFGASTSTSGTYTIANALTVQSGSAGTKEFGAYSNSVTYSGAITLNDSASLRHLAGSGTLTSSNGISVANGKTLTINPNSGTTIAIGGSGITGLGAVSTAGSSSGQVNLSANSNFSGGFTMGGSATLAILGSSAGSANSPTAGAFGTGTATLSGGSLRSTISADVTIHNTLNLSGTIKGATVETEKSVTFTGTGTLTGNTTLESAIGSTVAGKSMIFSGNIGDGGNNYGITKSGAGAVTLSGTNSYSGATLVSGGELRLASAGAINGTSSITVDSGRLSLDGGITVGSGKSVTINGDGGNSFGALQGYSGTNEWAGGVVVGSTAGTRIGVNAGQLTVSGTISGSNATNGLTLRPNAGTTLVISGANTYLGNTTIISTNTGSVKLDGGNDRLPTATKLVLGGSNVSGILDLNGRNQTVAGLSVAGTGSANEIKSATAANLTVNTTDASVFSGKISGATALTKTGTQSLTLSGNNTYTGTTAVNEGTLVINGNQSTAIGNVSVNNAGTRLKGTGTIGGDTTFNAGAIHSVGNSVGKQTFDDGTSTNLTYAQGSIFEWELGSTLKDSDTVGAVRGTDWDAVNVSGTLGTTGSGAIFRVVLDGTTTFADGFWAQDRQWLDIFKTSDAGSEVNFQSIFTSFQHYNYSGAGGSLADLGSPGTYGSFSIDGSTLKWTAVPEPTSALAGLLITAGLLRRRRHA
jgi:autotransporter-associated beta strand protein